MEEYSKVKIFGVIITPGYPEELKVLIKTYLSGIQAVEGEVKFLANCPEAFISCFDTLDRSFSKTTTWEDRSGRVINNDFVAIHCDEAAIFASGLDEAEVAVFNMKMRHLHKKVTKFYVQITVNETIEDIPF